MTLRTRFALPIAGLLLVAGAVGCKKSQAVPDQIKGRTAAQLLEEGHNLLKHGKWEAGRKVLRIIEESMPSAPEFPKAKLLIADSYFYGGSSNFPEGLVEYESFLNYFPRSDVKDYVLHRIGLCHYAAIEGAERDQAETRKALDAFQRLLRESPGSIYAVDAKMKITQCWRRLAESELMVGIFYVNSKHFEGAEKRLKGLLETYPEYVDRERAYYYLGEALRSKTLPAEEALRCRKAFLEKIQKDEDAKLSREEQKQLEVQLRDLEKHELEKYRQEARGYFQKLVESYPASLWAAYAKDRLLEMGHANVQEELDS